MERTTPKEVASHLEELALHNALGEGEDLHEHIEARWLPVVVRVLRSLTNACRVWWKR